MDKKLSNVKYELIASVSENLKEVMVTYTLNGQSHRYFVFVPKNNKKKDADYIKEAKTKFEADFKNGKIKPKKFKGGRNRPWLIATTCVLGVATLALGGFVVWKMFDNGEKKISYKEAQNWLDERYDYTGVVDTKVQSGDFSWDYSKSSSDLKAIIMPNFIRTIMEADKRSETIQKVLLKEKVNDFNCIDFDEQKEPDGHIYLVKQRNGEDLKSWVGKDNTPIKCLLKNDKLYVTFEGKRNMGESYIKFEETDIYNKNAVSIGAEFKIKNQKIITEKGSGTANGTVTASYNLSKFEVASNWIAKHYDSDDYERDIDSEVYEWDFTETKDKESQDTIFQILEEMFDITTDKLKETRTYPAIGKTDYAYDQEDFEDESEDPRTIFEIKGGELHTKQIKVPKQLKYSATLNYPHTYEKKFNNKCFKYFEKYTFNHSKSIASPNIEITGWLTSKITYMPQK